MEFHGSLPFLYIKETTIVFNGSSNWQATRTNKDRQQEQPEQERAAHHHTRQRVNLHAPGHGKRCWKKQGQPAKLITMWSLSGLRLPGVAPALGRARPDERTRSPSLPGFPPPVTLPACLPLADAALACRPACVIAGGVIVTRNRSSFHLE